MNELKKAFLKAKKNSDKKSRSCMFHKCQGKAIKSHVLQKNGILREITFNNHLIEQCPPNPFELKEKGILDFKSKGINDVYTFKGFCKTHDSEVFKPIEVNANLNFNRKIQQSLFSYRGLCQEIRRKEIATEWIKEIYDVLPIELRWQYDDICDGYKIGIKSLNYFKKELEKAIRIHDYSNFHFETITIPKIELCISVPLTIGDLKIPADNDFETWKKKQNRPRTTSFLNIFPKEEESIVITGYHKSYKCKWTLDFLHRLKKETKKEIFKELSDLIATRLEFWAMSESLFEKIDSNDISLYKDLFRANVYNHSPNQGTELNLFKYL